MTTTTSVSWIPTRKVLAGGLASVAAWGITTVLTHYGYTLPIDQTLLTSGIAWIAAYITPSSARDIITRLNNDLVRQAQDDPTVPVFNPRQGVMDPNAKPADSTKPAEAAIKQ